MRKFLIVLCSVMFVFLMTSSASALFFDFSGGDGSYVNFAVFTAGAENIHVVADEVPSDRDLYLGSSGLGVIGGSGDSSQVDGSGTDEYVIFSFSQDVYLRSVTFASVAYNDDFVFYVGDESSGDFTQVGGNIDIPVSNTYTFFGTYLSSVFAIGAEYYNDDFYVAGMDVSPVPEPGTIVLMGLGLVGLAGMGRKKLFKK